jgi:transcriptional regulator with XRE-family HTH domain
MEIGRFPNKLRFYRHCSEYSQKKVARMLGLADTSLLSRWEHGKAYPSLVQVFRLARMYHVTPQQLFSDLWFQTDTEFSLLAQENEPCITNCSVYE